MNPTPPPIRFAIVGCGAIAPTHARAIRELGHVVAAVADPIEARARKLADEFDIPAVFADSADLINGVELDAVCICSPSGMHASQAIDAVRAGRHVLVEKPMDVSIEACDRLIDEARRAGVRCGIVSQHRFDAASLIARRLIEDGRVGRMLLATGDVKWYRTQAYYDEGDWRGTWRLDGGGALINQAIHTLDLLQWLAGGVASVHARALIAAAHERIEVEDVAVLSLRFSGGAIGTLTATTAAYEGLPARIELFGTEGSILIEGDNLRRVSLKTGETFETAEAAQHAIDIARGGTAHATAGAASPPLIAGTNARWGDAHRAQIADFVDAIRTGRDPMIDAPAGRAPVAIAVAAYESARTGQEVEVSAARDHGQRRGPPR